MDKQRRIVAYPDGLQAKVNALRERWSSRASAFLACIETQSAGGDELRPFFGWTLVAPVLDRAFKGEL